MEVWLTRVPPEMGQKNREEIKDVISITNLGSQIYIGTKEGNKIFELGKWDIFIPAKVRRDAT